MAPVTTGAPTRPAATASSLVLGAQRSASASSCTTSKTAPTVGCRGRTPEGSSAARLASPLNGLIAIGNAGDRGPTEPLTAVFFIGAATRQAVCQRPKDAAPATAETVGTTRCGVGPTSETVALDIGEAALAAPKRARGCTALVVAATPPAPRLASHALASK